MCTADFAVRVTAQHSSDLDDARFIRDDHGVGRRDGTHSALANDDMMVGARGDLGEVGDR